MTNPISLNLSTSHHPTPSIACFAFLIFASACGGVLPASSSSSDKTSLTPTDIAVQSSKMESSNTTEAKPVVRVERDPHTSTDGLALQSCDLQIVEFLVIKTCADYQFVYSLVPHDTPHTAESFRKEERNALAGFMDGVGNVDAFPSHATIGDRRRIPFYEIREKSGETRPVRGLISIQPIRRGLSIVVCMQKSPSGSANGCLNLIDPVLTKDPPQDVQTALVGTLATKRLEAALGSREKD